jgi:hypothetical protein
VPEYAVIFVIYCESLLIPICIFYRFQINSLVIPVRAVTSFRQALTDSLIAAGAAPRIFAPDSADDGGECIMLEVHRS